LYHITEANLYFMVQYFGFQNLMHNCNMYICRLKNYQNYGESHILVNMFNMLTQLIVNQWHIMSPEVNN